MVMPGFVNYFYEDGQLPTHTKNAFCDLEILIIHGLIVKHALTMMHRIKYFQSTVPKSIINLFPDNMPNHTSNHDYSSEWLHTYSKRGFRSSIFFKGPLLTLTNTNKQITSLPSLFSLSIYKKNAKRVLLDEQRIDGLEGTGTWSPFLLNNIPGLRKSAR